MLAMQVAGWRKRKGDKASNSYRAIRKPCAEGISKRQQGEREISLGEALGRGGGGGGMQAFGETAATRPQPARGALRREGKS